MEKKLVSQHDGVLEIDHERGVIYFHDNSNGSTLLRICRLGKIEENITHIDITHMYGVQIVNKEKT